MKVALVYDRVNKWGGAERVLLALHKIFPNAPLYTSVYHPKKAPWAKVFNIKTSFLQFFPKASSSHESYAPLMPFAFESFSFDKYDLVISVTSEAAKGVITGSNTLHICYLLTPTRYLWSGYDEYFKNKAFRIFTKPVVYFLRNWDKKASRKPDHIIAISKEVENRVKKYYEREVKIIYPPVEIRFKKLGKNKKKDAKNKDYFLIVSRLVPYKKIEIAIRACNELNLPLKIIGTGSSYKRLKEIAGETVEFLGELTDAKLSYYYENCKALIFPGIEEFGLVMVEAQAFGKPVIAYKKGGALDIIKDGVTGVFFNKQTVSSLKKVLKNFDHKRYNSLLSKNNAKRFSFNVFKKKFKRFIKKNLKNK